MNTAALFSSASTDWSTPQYLWDGLHREFGFTVDVCATGDNAKCAHFFTEDDDGLSRDWRGVAWCNPPYGRTIGRWVEKAYQESSTGATVVCLVPARTDTAWWHDWAMLATEIRYIRGRLKFGNAKHGAPFPSAILIFRPFGGAVVWEAVR